MVQDPKDLKRGLFLVANVGGWWALETQASVVGIFKTHAFCLGCTLCLLEKTFSFLDTAWVAVSYCYERVLNVSHVSRH